MRTKCFSRANTIVYKTKSIYVIYYLFSIKCFLIWRYVSWLSYIFYRERLTQIRIIFVSIILTKELIVFTYTTTYHITILFITIEYSLRSTRFITSMFRIFYRSTKWILYIISTFS